MTLLLDSYVRRRLGQRAFFVTEAAYLLGLDDPSPEQIDSACAPVFELLQDGEIEAGLDQLRNATKALGSKSRPPKLNKGEDSCLSRLSVFADRASTDRVVPGLTVHQAKGREWPQVGVLLSEGQRERLTHGLDQDRHGDRVLYVALTRAKDRTVLLGS